MPTISDPIERIPVPDGTLVLTRNHMVIERGQGQQSPADLDLYEPYLPVVMLMREIPRSPVNRPNSHEEVIRQLRLALSGKHTRLSVPLLGQCLMQRQNADIVDRLSPQSVDGCTRALCLIQSDGVYDDDCSDYPFVCREELYDVLSVYMGSSYAAALAECGRKGRLAFDGLKQQELGTQASLCKLPTELVEAMRRVRYLPSRRPAELALKYAAIAATELTCE